MLIKIVFINQIHLFDSKNNTPNIDDIHLFIKRTFTNITQPYTLYYIDEDQDHILLMTNDDLNNYTEVYGKKKKIYIEVGEQQGLFLAKIKKSSDEDRVKVQAQLSHLKEIKQNNQGTIELRQQNINQDQQQSQQLKQKIFELKQHAQKKIALTKYDEIKQIDDKDQIQQIKQTNYKQKKGCIKKEQHHNVLEQIQPQKDTTQKEVHASVKCDSCGMMPIVGIRFKCGVCQNYNLCQHCQEEKGHYQHPLIKIRFVFQTPLKAIFLFPKDTIKSISGQMREKIRYETEIERLNLITSYLQNLLDQQNSQKYEKFALQSKSLYYEQLFDEYLEWVKNQQGNIPKLIKWFQSHLPSFQPIDDLPIN